MKLKVVNYKGVLNMGIERAEYNEKDDRLYLDMRAMSNKINDIAVSGFSGKSFEKNSRLYVQRFLKPIHSENSNTEEPLKDGVFDSEFHYREGVLEGQPTRLPAQSETHGGGKPTEPHERPIRQKSGKFCPYSELVLLW